MNKQAKQAAVFYIVENLKELAVKARDIFAASFGPDNFPYPIGIVWNCERLGNDFPLVYCTTRNPSHIVYEVVQWSEAAISTLYPVFPEQLVVEEAFHLHVHTPDLGEEPQKANPPSGSRLREYLKERLVSAISHVIGHMPFVLSEQATMSSFFNSNPDSLNGFQWQFLDTDEYPCFPPVGISRLSETQCFIYGFINGGKR